MCGGGGGGEEGQGKVLSSLRELGRSYITFRDIYSQNNFREH